MKHVKIVGWSLAVVLVVVGIAATPASAAGLYWFFEGKRLEAGENREIKVTNLEPELLGSIKLATSLVAIECPMLLATGKIFGGTPAKGSQSIFLSECVIPGHAECTVASPGNPVGKVTFSANTEIVFLENKEGGPAGDWFTPPAGETLVELVIGGVGCPPFVKGEQEVKGSMIAEFKPVNEEVLWAHLAFEKPPIKSGWRLKKPAELEEVKASLKMFGVIEATFAGNGGQKIL